MLWGIMLRQWVSKPRRFEATYSTHLQEPISIVDLSWPMKNRDPFVYCREVISRKNGIPFCIAGYYTHAVLPFAFYIVCTEPLNYAAAHNLAPASFLGYLVPKFLPADSP